MHQPRHPADAAFEEGKLQSRESVQHAAKNEPRRANHIRQRKPKRGGKMLKALEAFAADEPGMAVLQLKNPRRGVKQNGDIEIGDFLIERP